MKFMMLMKATEASETGAPPPPALMEAIGKAGAEAMAAGVMLDTGGLAPSAQGTRIRAGAGGLKVIDGPFAETKELVDGYAIFELPSKAAAVEHGRQFMQLHLDLLGPGYEGELEIRQLFKEEDFARGLKGC